MQGPGSSVTTLPENLIFDNGSTSSDAGVDSQMPWNNNMQISAQNRLPDYIIPSSDSTHNQYLQHARHEVRNAEWCLGETSSRATLDLEQRQYGPYNIISSDNVEINPAGDQITNGAFLLPNSGSNAVPQDLNMNLEFEDQDDDDDCRVIEHPASCVSIGSSNEQIRSNGCGPVGSYGAPACGGYMIDESEDRPRMSCKRKALEGQSSGVGTSNCFQNTIPENNISMPIRASNNIVINSRPEQANPRLGLGVGRSVSSSPFSSIAPGNPESSRRNFRLRINGLHHQQDPITPEIPLLTDQTDVGNVDISSSRHSSRLVLRNRLLDLNPVENGSPHGQSALLDVPSVRRIHQSRWTGSSSSRRSTRSSSATPISEEGPAQRTFPRRISEHPMFVPASETRNSSQNLMNWHLSGVGNNNNNNSIAGNVASTSRVGSSRGESSSAPSWPHRSFPQYPRRLSEIVRRTLLSSAAGNGSGDRSVFNHADLSGSSAIAQDNHGRHVPISRSTLLERHLDGASGVPYSWRTLAGAGEGRSTLMSEIRHVLDLMRRGEGLRVEDFLILDQSVLFGMADIHDRHRDMRLDVDNMSYEELLALEERIGNVCTGLTEETILSHLKQRLFVDSEVEDQVETEPCSICREEYIDGEDLGSLECGHDFHKDCIKQWLMHKNLCPICKTTGLTT